MTGRLFKISKQLGIMVHVYNVSPGEAEAEFEASLGYIARLCLKKKKKSPKIKVCKKQEELSLLSFVLRVCPRCPTPSQVFLREGNKKTNTLVSEVYHWVTCAHPPHTQGLSGGKVHLTTSSLTGSLGFLCHQLPLRFSIYKLLLHRSSDFQTLAPISIWISSLVSRQPVSSSPSYFPHQGASLLAEQVKQNSFQDKSVLEGTLMKAKKK
jgi:hypothetical protein